MSQEAILLGDASAGVAPVDVKIGEGRKMETKVPVLHPPVLSLESGQNAPSLGGKISCFKLQDANF